MAQECFTNTIQDRCTAFVFNPVHPCSYIIGRRWLPPFLCTALYCVSVLDNAIVTMTAEKKTAKPWGGRFTEATDSFVEQFTQSVSFDRRLASCDIQCSIAHATMLTHVGVLSAAEAEQITAGLNAILEEIEAGKFTWKQELEDVHMNIEAALVERVGEVGKKVHTGRSRNDQVATDLRLYLRAEVETIGSLLLQNRQALVTLAEQEADTLMPGFTHLQAAQPITFGHHILAWYEMLKRDRQRLGDCLARINVMPLGAAALAGHALSHRPVFYRRVAGIFRRGGEFTGRGERSGFHHRVLRRGRVGHAAFIPVFRRAGPVDVAVIRFCRYRRCVLYRFLHHAAEEKPGRTGLVRGKTGRVYGDLMGILTIMKGQPLAYNRDNQEDKECLFDATDTVKLCLEAYANLLPSIRVNRQAMLAAAEKGCLTATDLADYLVMKGVAFRDAHAIVGNVVQYAMQRGCELDRLELPELAEIP